MLRNALKQKNKSPRRMQVFWRALFGDMSAKNYVFFGRLPSLKDKLFCFINGNSNSESMLALTNWAILCHARLVKMIITEAKDMLRCERCTVFLLDLKMYDQVNQCRHTKDSAKTKIRVFLLIGPLRWGGVKPPEPLSKIVFLNHQRKDMNH